MSSPYPVLDNRPIDQWKVTELKEELKRRKLITRGLKEDLIKRLDEAIRHDTETAKEDTDNGFHGTPPGEVETGGLATNSVGAEMAKDMELGDSRKEVDEEVVQVQIDESAVALGLGKSQERGTIGGTDPTRNGELEFNAISVAASVTVTESVGPEVARSVQELENSKTQKESNETNNESDDLNPHIKNAVLENEEMVAHAISTETSVKVTQSAVAEIALSLQESQSNETHDESGDLKPHEDNEAPRRAHEDVDINSSDPHNQVYEVSLDSGFQVKSDSNFTDNNEKNELKDNITANKLKPELDVKPEMVQQLPNIVVPDGGKLHPMDVEESPEEKVSVEDRDDGKVANAEISEKNDSVDMGSSEKLNLDRSSGDDSMEEDAMDSKHTESQFNSDEMRGRSDKVEVTMVKEKSPVDVMLDDLPSDKVDVPGENTKANLDASTVKRKLNDQSVGNNENLKRQRRWNSESHKVTLPQSNDLASSTTPKDMVPATSFTRSFSRSNSTVSENAPKERVVPPSPKPPSNSLRIDRFLRPFTLKAVQELLGKTGTVTSFWMDHIKTHCYVTYSSVEEATETRNAVYNLQWPPNGGRLLVAEFVDPQEVKTRVEAPTQSPTTPVSTGPKNVPFPSGPTYPTAPSTLQPQPSPRQQFQAQRQHLQPPPPPLPLPPPPPPLSNPPQARERLPLPPPPPLPEKVDPPILTLDDLFRKTKAIPRIYYLPLSDEQVAEKLKAKGTA